MTNRLSMVDYIHELKEAGFTDKQARRLEQFSELIQVQHSEIETLKAEEPVSKGDIYEVKQEIKQIEPKIAKTKNQILLWVVGILSANSIFFLRILAKGFHWW